MARERPVEEQDTNSIPLVNRSMLPPRRPEIKSEKGPSLGNWLIDLNIIIRGIRYCLSVRVGVMCLATSFAIFLCSKAVLNLEYNTSLEIVTYGTIFPLTFGIQCAFGHREGAIKGLATVKALCAAIYMQANAWDRSGTGVIAEKLRSILMEMTKNMEIYCRNPINTQVSYPISRKINPKSADHFVYDAFAKLAAVFELHGPDMGYEVQGTKGGFQGKGRLIENLRRLICAWESVKLVRNYTSPKVLRNFCFFTIHALPILLAPYWCHFCKSDHADLLDPEKLYGCFSGYFLGMIFCIVLITLDKVFIRSSPPFPPSKPASLEFSNINTPLCCHACLPMQYYH